jgi:peptide/nickel transport system permease protein
LTTAFDPTREQPEALEPLSEESAAGIAARSPLELFWRRLKDDKVALASAGFIVFLVLCAIFAPLLVKLVGVTGPNVQNPDALDSFGTPTGPFSTAPAYPSRWRSSQPRSR